MRRLLIIGNGFDISHGLRTSYEDFIYNYLVKCLIQSVKNIRREHNKFIHEHKDLLIHLKFNYLETSNLRLNRVSIENILDFVNEYNSYRKLMNELVERKMISTVNQNSLLTRIYSNKLIYNWVDIEIEYFEKLKEILYVNQTKSSDKLTRIGQVVKLNFELDYLKGELINYLSTSTSIKNNYESTFLKQYENILFETNSGNSLKNPTLLLNFNYTNTVREVYNNFDYKVINLHGNLSSDIEDVVFGYGNEDDPRFKDLLRERDSDICLKNYKMYSYSSNVDYPKLQGFMIDSFWLTIVGHSCGISDSTIFSKILKHNNLEGVDIYYYDKNNDGKKNHFDSLNRSISTHLVEDINIFNDLNISFDVNKKIPQSPRRELLNNQYVNSDFNKEILSVYTETINDYSNNSTDTFFTF